MKELGLSKEGHNRQRTWRKLRNQTIEAEFSVHLGQARVLGTPARYKVVCCGRRWGKALSLDTPIPTPTGWTTMGEIQEGDQVIDENGDACRVLFATEIQTGRTCYRVRFDDGSEIVADADHQWLTWDRAARKSYGRSINPGLRPKVRTTADMAPSVLIERPDGRIQYNFSVANGQPLNLPTRRLPLDPYVLGVWLGDGGSMDARITVGAQDEVEMKRQLELAGCKVQSKANSQGTYTMLLGKGTCKKRNDLGQFGPTDSVCSSLRGIGVIGNKHVPAPYMRASKEQRLALLQGLMDTDGYSSPNGHVEFCSISERLACAVYELACSLGQKPLMARYRATLYGKDCGFRYRVKWTPRVPVFRLPRKAALYCQTGKRVTVTGHRRIVAIEPIDSVPVRCISVDSPSHLYLAGRSMIPTHNTTCGVLACMEGAARGQKWWWVAPIYPVSSIGWKELKRMARALPVNAQVEIREADRELRFPGGGSVTVKSAHDPDSLRGEGLDGVVFDEAAYIQRDCWYEVIRPALADRQGCAIFISTPAGMNWFSEMFDLAKSGRNPDWAAFQYPTWDNPHIPQVEIDAAREDMGTQVFMQEFGAEFIKDLGTIFKSEWFQYYYVQGEQDDIWFYLHRRDGKITRYSYSSLRRWAAVDLAVSQKESADYTVVCVVGETPDADLLVLDVLRTRQEMPDIAPLLLRAQNKWKTDMVGIESGGFQLGVVQQALRQGVIARPLTAKGDKTARARPVAARMEAGKVYFDAESAWLRDFETELLSFPPSTGGHDDQVDALAWADFQRFTGGASIRVI